MTAQYLEYIRQQLIVATADLSGCTKGQLLAWTENAQFDTKRLKRKRLRMWDEVTEKMVPVPGDPVPGHQSRAKGSSIALVQPVEFSTASWRRAVLASEEHQKAWLLWIYSENICWDHQVAITNWGWSMFSESIGCRRIAGKTRDKLRSLIWLAAQEAKHKLQGRSQYSGVEMAEMMDVEEKNWSKTFNEHWQSMKELFLRLDVDSLNAVSKIRSQQKSANYHLGIAKVENIAHT